MHINRHELLLSLIVAALVFGIGMSLFIWSTSFVKVQPEEVVSIHTFSGRTKGTDKTFLNAQEQTNFMAALDSMRINPIECVEPTSGLIEEVKAKSPFYMYVSFKEPMLLHSQNDDAFKIKAQEIYVLGPNEYGYEMLIKNQENTWSCLQNVAVGSTQKMYHAAFGQDDYEKILSAVSLDIALMKKSITYDARYCKAVRATERLKYQVDINRESIKIVCNKGQSFASGQINIEPTKTNITFLKTGNSSVKDTKVKINGISVVKREVHSLSTTINPSYQKEVSYLPFSTIVKNESIKYGTKYLAAGYTVTSNGQITISDTDGYIVDNAMKMIFSSFER